MECLRTNATPPALWLYKRRAPILRRHRHKSCAGSFMASWRVAVRAASKSLSNRWIVKWQSFFFFFPLISYNLRNRIDRFLSFATATFPNHVCKRIWKYWRLTVVIVLLLMLWSWCCEFERWIIPHKPLNQECQRFMSPVNYSFHWQLLSF